MAGGCTAGAIRQECGDEECVRPIRDFVRPSLPADIRLISLRSETGNFSRRLGARLRPPALESRSSPPLA